MGTEDILTERAKTHGDFGFFAVTCQSFKAAMQASSNWDILPDTHKEALEMVCHKMARVLEGDFNHKDHWDDIAGYATLVAKTLTDEPHICCGNCNK
jgi:hypothetical protein